MSGLSTPGGKLVGGGKLMGAGLGRRLPRRLWLLLIPLLLLPLLPWFPTSPFAAPTQLGGATLVGEPPDSPIRLAVVLDVSGSMTSHWASREQALQDLVTWGAGELRPDDALSVFVFADSAQLILPETPIQELKDKGLNLLPIGDVGGGSDFTTVIPLMQEHLGPQPHVVAWVTDTDVLVPSRDELYQATSAMGVYSTTTVIPGGGSGMQSWREALPGTHYLHIDGLDSNATGIAMAEAIANATGQRVVRK